MNTNPTSKGIKTTEFWLILLAHIITAAMAHLDKIDAHWAAVSITVLTGIYALIRAALKNQILQEKGKSDRSLLHANSVSANK